MMCDVFTPLFPSTEGEPAEALRGLLLDEILSLNGQPSIRQCERLADMLVARGGPSMPAETMRAEFQSRLDRAIEQRTLSIRNGEAAKEDYIVHGAAGALNNLASRGIAMAILSSTRQEPLQAEATLLGLDRFFEHRIFGSPKDPSGFAKRAVFERLLKDHGLDGNALLSFGDGPVEIGDTVGLGGTAIAICSDEERNGSGIMDERKRRLLHAAGAQAELPDYREAPALLDFLFGR